jgi:hypothetical protein
MTPLELIELGFAVCEVATPKPDGTCTCRLGHECPSPGKHPVGKAWLAGAVARRARGYRRLPAFVTLAPTTSYGLIPPPGSGLLVVDRDDPNVLLPMPETFEVHRASADPRKGHYYYRLADSIAEADVPRAFAGGEVRVAGSGHVVGPGCRHVSGDTYEGNDLDVAYADRDLIDALTASKPVRRTADGGVGPVEGSRHAFLVGQARKMAGWGWDLDRIAERLEELNATVCEPPLDERVAEVGRMAEWAAKNIAPDRGPTVRRRGKKAHADPWEWMR